MRTLSQLLRAVLIGALILTAGFAAEDAKKTYDIPAGDAAAALKQFSALSGRETLFAAEAVRGVKTPAVRGELTVQEAIDALLADTGLIATADEKSGAIAVRRESAVEAKNDASRLADAEAADSTRTRIQNGTVQMEKFEVTGTKVTGVVNQGIIPREENQAVRYSIISRADIERSGVTSLSELMRNVSSNAEYSNTPEGQQAGRAATSGQTFAFGDQINLRGLGNGQTLVMINGRRLYGRDGSGNGAGADIGRIPLAAVERVEILPVSGSAIYGANSVGGVVNVIMRKGYSGTEIGTYFGGSKGGGEEYRLNLFHGRSFNEGRSNFSLTLDYQRKYELLSGERAYYRHALANPAAQPPSPAFVSEILSTLTGPLPTIRTTSPLGLGIPSNPTATLATVPTGSSGLGLTPNDFNATAGQTGVSTVAIARLPLLPNIQGRSAILNFDHELFGDRLGLYVELMGRTGERYNTFPRPSASYSLSATDPRNPFRTGVTPGFVGRAITITRATEDLPDYYQIARDRTVRAVAGFQGKWTTADDRSFNWALDGSWDRNATDADYVTPVAGLTAAATAGIYNLLRDLTGVPQFSKEEADKYAYTLLARNFSTVTAANFRLNGDLMRMWGGPARFSLGAEQRKEEFSTRTGYTNIGEYNALPGGAAAPGASLAPGGSLVFSNVVPTETERNVTAGYAELVLPLVGEPNRQPWLHSLELSGGLRYEKYTDFKAARPPALAAKMGVTRDFALRVAYMEGFQPPTLAQLDPTVTTSTSTATAYVDVLRPGQPLPNSYQVIASGNPDLTPETTKTWDVGVILTPRWLPGFTLNVSYFRYDKRNSISTLSLADAILFDPSLVIRAAPTPADTAAGMPGIITGYYSIPKNSTRLETDGVDFDLNYRISTEQWGQFALVAQATWNREFLAETRPGIFAATRVGVAPTNSATFLLRWKGYGGIQWQKGVWAASVMANYSSSFQTSTTEPTAENPTGSGIDGASIGPHCTIDTQVSYSIPLGGSAASNWRRWAGGTKWSLGVRNLFDAEPPTYTDRRRNYYFPLADPRQQFVYLQIKKTL
jgi:outer membrane receptor protein involved in Fe transport